MAGSYNHVVDDIGALLDFEGINNALDCQSGDVVEAIEEMYGMLWYLADGNETVIEEARQNWKKGYSLSPTSRQPYC